MPANFPPLLTRFIVGSFFPFGPLRMTCLVRDADLVAAAFSVNNAVSVMRTSTAQSHVSIRSNFSSRIPLPSRAVVLEVPDLARASSHPFECQCSSQQLVQQCAGTASEQKETEIGADVRVQVAPRQNFPFVPALPHTTASESRVGMRGKQSMVARRDRPLLPPSPLLPTAKQLLMSPGSRKASSHRVLDLNLMTLDNLVVATEVQRGLLQKLDRKRPTLGGGYGDSGLAARNRFLSSASKGLTPRVRA